MKTVDIKYYQIVQEMEEIENEAGICFNTHRKEVARLVINHFTKEHIPPLKEKPPSFTIPKEIQDETPIEGSAEIVRSEGVDVLRPPIS